MKFSKRLVAGLSGTVLATSALMIVGASPASAVAPSGGCWVYSVPAGTPIESTTPQSNTSSSLAPWTATDDGAQPIPNPLPPADYTLTSSGSNLLGGTRNFSLTFDRGPKNGGPPASGTAYYYFSAGGVNLPAIPVAFSAPGGAEIPGATVTGSFQIAAAGATTITFRKVIYDIPSFFTRVGCNGQTGGTPNGVNPATTPVDTNITNSFTALLAPATTISSISNQTVNTHARAGDSINFSVTNYGAAGTGTVSLCDSNGANCDAATSTVAIDGSGAGTGSYPVTGTSTIGARKLKVVGNGNTTLTTVTILTSPASSFTTDTPAGAAGTVVGFTGGNWDPNQQVIVRGYSTGGQNATPTTDPPVTVTADPSGNITGSFTVNDATTIAIGASRVHASGPPPTILFAFQGFSFGNTCVAKVGAATTGTCSLFESVKLKINPGDLKMSKVAGDVVIGGVAGVTLGAAAQTATGTLQDVTVMDYRGGILGWSLVGRFTGLTGPAKATTGFHTIPSSALSWTPSCAAQSNNDDTVSQGTGGAFTTTTTDLALCAVTGVPNMGADVTSGGDTIADAGLSLVIPANQAVGNYSGSIQLTLS